VSKWWHHQDLNLWPTDPETGMLTTQPLRLVTLELKLDLSSHQLPPWKWRSVLRTHLKEIALTNINYHNYFTVCNRIFQLIKSFEWSSICLEMSIMPHRRYLSKMVERIYMSKLAAHVRISSNYNRSSQATGEVSTPKRTSQNAERCLLCCWQRVLDYACDVQPGDVDPLLAYRNCTGLPVWRMSPHFIYWNALSALSYSRTCLPHHAQNSFGDHCFATAGPSLWNTAATRTRYFV